MSRLRIVIVTASVLLVAGCSSHSGKPSAGPTTGPSPAVSSPGSTPSTSSPSPSASVSSTPVTTPTAGGATNSTPITLPNGKLDLALTAGVWKSPVGFAPVLRFTVPTGWNSVHRGPDGFDIGQIDPSGQPRVAIVFLTPKSRTAGDAMTAVTTAANGNVEPTTGSIGSMHADTIDITGGSGQLIASRANGIALDAADGQQVRLFALTVGGAPLMVAVVVPQSAQFDTVWPSVEPILASVKFG